MTPVEPKAMLAALTDPHQLQVFAAMAAVTGPGHYEEPWYRPSPNTISFSYLTPTGAAKRTGLSVAEALAAFRRLEAVCLALPSRDNPERNGWRLNTQALVEASSPA